MTHALPPLTKDRIEAFAASAMVWCVGLVDAALKLIAPHRRLTRFVERTERDVESILFLKAFSRSRLGEAEALLRRSLVGPCPPRPATPRSIAPGFRRRATRGRMRLFFRNAGVRARKASLIALIASLAAALAKPEPHIAYFFKRMLRDFRAPALVADAAGAAFPADSS